MVLLFAICSPRWWLGRRGGSPVLLLAVGRGRFGFGFRCCWIGVPFAVGGTGGGGDTGDEAPDDLVEITPPVLVCREVAVAVDVAARRVFVGRQVAEEDVQGDVDV